MGPKKKSDDSKKKKKQQDNPESKLKAHLADVEKERTNLNVHISFLKQKLTDARLERSTNLKSVENAQDVAKRIEDNYIDILNHRDQLMKSSEQKLSDLEHEVGRLKSEIAKRDSSISKLEDSNRKNLATLSECDSLLEDKQKLDQMVKSQSAIVEKQSKEIDELIDRKHRLEIEIENRDKEIQSLRLRVEDKSELKILFDEICFIRQKHRLTLGEAPLDQSGASLTTATDGNALVIIGGNHEGNELAVFDVLTWTWTRQGVANQPFRSLCDHSSCLMNRSKIVTFGGIQNGLPSFDAMLFNMETMKWQSLDLSRMISPTARSKHSSCVSCDCLFVFGGVIDDEFSDQMWMLDMESMEWKHLVVYGDGPSPRSGASISITEDGRKLYLFGGFDGSRSLNDLYTFDIEKQIWNSISTLNACPQGRHSHVSSLIGHFMMIAGGTGQCNDGDGGKPLGDVHILDLISLRWEVLDDGSWISNFPWMKPGGSYMAMNGSRLMIVKPDRHDRLSQITLYDITLPDEITQMRNRKKNDSSTRTKLEILNGVCFSNSIEIQWAPPSQNADRIDHYKLMMATLSGTVKDIYQGQEQNFRLTGLRANTEYILCVKAIYDDGSHIWSESKSYKTKAVS
eukprot:g2456.t1